MGTDYYPRIGVLFDRTAGLLADFSFNGDVIQLRYGSCLVYPSGHAELPYRISCRPDKTLYGADHHHYAAYEPFGVSAFLEDVQPLLRAGGVLTPYVVTDWSAEWEAEHGSE